MMGARCCSIALATMDVVAHNLRIVNSYCDIIIMTVVIHSLLLFIYLVNRASLIRRAASGSAGVPPAACQDSICLRENL